MSPARRSTAFVDEVALEAPAVAPALELALAELLDADLPALDARLAELLDVPDAAVVLTTEVATTDATATVVPLAAWRRRTGRRAVIAGGAVVTLLAATTGLAAASVLPAPVQRAVAAAAARVGVELPSPDHQVPTTLAPDTAAGPDSTALAALPPEASSGVAPSTTASPSTAAVTRPTTPSPAAAPAPTSPPPAPPASGEVGRPSAFAAAVAAFRQCLRADEDGVRCVPPDPAAFGVAPSSQPADVAAFRAAVLAYVACIRAAGVRSAATACVRPRPADFGLVPRFSSPPSTDAASPPSPEPTRQRPRPGDGQRPTTTPPVTSVPPDRAPGVSGSARTTSTTASGRVGSDSTRNRDPRTSSSSGRHRG